MRFMFVRVLIVLAMTAPLAVIAAPNPASGTLTEIAPELNYTGGPMVVSDPEGLCPNNQVCEVYNLTVSLPADFDVRRPNDLIRARLEGMSSADGVIAILDSNGKVLAEQDGPFVNGPETVTTDAVPGETRYGVRVRLFAGSTPSYSVKITLTTTPPAPPGGDAYAPRFQFLTSPPALGNGAAEPSIGYNPKSKRAMFQSGLETLRVTFAETRKDDALNPDGLPEACNALWEDVSFPTTSTASLDPIGLMDYTTGRYYASQLGAKSNNMAFTDDDGESWTPSVGNFPGAAGVDHQSVGWGPYVAGGSARPLTSYPNAIYYCSQDIAYANCSRSDDGGRSFLPPVFAYNVSECGGLHGHIRAAPDGTVYLPNKGCSGNQAVVVSEDNGLNWQVRKIPTSTPGASDPQMSLATDGTGYFCYVADDGQPRVAVTRDKGKTWSDDTDLGSQVGVEQAVFAQGIAGDPDRAACGFLGTDTAGNFQGEDFLGIWYAYISVTYDGGKTWSTTNVTPNDPAQGVGGIWLGGGGNVNRNLLDFNEMTLDEKGRAMLGFADGCIGTCVANHNSRSDKAAIARIIGGRSLIASFDRPEPHAPQAACLAGTRTTDSAALTWRPPADDGKSTVTNYKIYRGTTQASQSLLVTVSPKTAYTDYNADPMEPEYFYKIVAVNALGDSVFSNLIELPIDVNTPPETPCVLPGLTILQDAEGDALDEQPAHDVRKLSISQPYFENGDYKLFFTLKMQSLASVPQNTTWPIRFCSPAFANCTDTNAAISATNKYYTVRMVSPGPSNPGTTPIFQILKPNAANNTVSTVSADPASGFNANGTITIVVKASDIGLTNEGAGVEKLNRFLVRIRVEGGAVALTPDNMPDSVSGGGEFATKALNFCATNTPPQPDLDVSTQSGNAPLTVLFDASGSTDADSQDSIAEYIFDFGDNTEVISQSTPTISHTYTDDGFYNAKVRVKDSRGLPSSTAAAMVIEVKAVAGQAQSSADNNQIGGALSSLSLLMLSLLSVLGLRRRSVRRW